MLFGLKDVLVFNQKKKKSEFHNNLYILSVKKWISVKKKSGATKLAKSAITEQSEQKRNEKKIQFNNDNSYNDEDDYTNSKQDI